MTQDKHVRPFLKWAGNKYKVLPRILAALSPSTRLIEPFMGSGSLMLNRPTKIYLGGDINPDLISVFQFFKDEGQEFVEYIRPFFTLEYFTSLGEDGEKTFYAAREEFNTSIDLRRKAALFIYLNQHCFNGLCRYNRHGKFTTPYNLGFKKHGKPAEFFEERYTRTIKMCKGATFKTAPFEELMVRARPGDTIYCDPPYLPQDDKEATFTQYAKEGEFNLEQQKLLATLAGELRIKGVTTVISNHDSQLASKIYHEADEKMVFDVKRSMGRYEGHANSASELLVIYRPAGC